MNGSYASENEDYQLVDKNDNTADQGILDIKETTFNNLNQKNFDSLNDDSHKRPTVSTLYDQSSDQLLEFQRSSMGNNKTYFNQSDEVKLHSLQTVYPTDLKDVDEQNISKSFFRNCCKKDINAKDNQGIGFFAASSALLCRIVGVSSRTFYYLLSEWDISVNYFIVYYSWVLLLLVLLIPVQCQMNRDYNGYKGFKTSIVSVTAAFIFYLVILGSIWVMVDDLQCNNYCKDNNICKDGSITTNCIYYFAIFRQFDKSFAVSAFIIIIFKATIQGILTMHIALEQICILFDEIFYQSLTSNVLLNVIKKPDNQNNRYDIKEVFSRIYQIKDDKSSQDPSEETNTTNNDLYKKLSLYDELKQKKYWMAHMNIPKRYRYFLATILFLVNFLIIGFRIQITTFINLLGSSTIPLLIYCYPGYLYYRYKIVNNHKNERNSIIVGRLSLAFGIFGLMLIFCYLSVYLFNISTYANI
ncbi:UNKNOWN [Stylonychia lemnae]|uniref:Uncharacterized protein n=1 Tax=Stylonychia lemnae TaxID=5949 RepID=A0A078BA49_STYLE|nr:UNKNOWN [Stylonychia lemnae]|eukprot:CDW91375.1 UNKNOWN [Stylonychia lemnae]